MSRPDFNSDRQGAWGWIKDRWEWFKGEMSCGG